jgi:hypothetical protein
VDSLLVFTTYITLSHITKVPNIRTKITKKIR